MLTKEPEMLQPDAFCQHTMQQNATAAGAPPDPRLVSRGPLRGGEGKGKGGKGKGGERKEGEEGEGRLTLIRSWNRAAGWLRPALLLFTNAILFYFTVAQVSKSANLLYVASFLFVFSCSLGPEPVRSHSSVVKCLISLPAEVAAF